MWQIADSHLTSRLFVGTSMYPSPKIMLDAIESSEAEVVTVALRRMDPANRGGDDFWEILKALPVKVLPNTAGCHSPKEAITTALMARELFGTNWIKLEVIGDEYTLQPDPFGLLEAATELLSQGFDVFPYCTDDLVLCEKLVSAGCKILMPWAAPIGSGRGLMNPYALKTLRARLPDINLIVDAGLGAPSHACQAMELGYDGVLLNTAIANAEQPVAMAAAFKHAVIAGREGYKSGIMPMRDLAKPSTPTMGTPFVMQ